MSLLLFFISGDNTFFAQRIGGVDGGFFGGFLEEWYYA